MTGVEFRLRYRWLGLERPFKQLVPHLQSFFFFFPLVKYHLGEINFADYCVSVEERHPLQMSWGHSCCIKQDTSTTPTFRGKIKLFRGDPESVKKTAWATGILYYFSLRKEPITSEFLSHWCVLENFRGYRITTLKIVLQSLAVLQGAPYFFSFFFFR